MASTLTTFQGKLLKDLEKEFSRLNPTSNNNDTQTRFSISVIENCINEKQKFIDSVKSYNVAIAKVLYKALEKDLKCVKKDFGKYINIQDGMINIHQPSMPNFYNTKAFFDAASEPHKSTEAKIFLVSKTRKVSDIYNGANGFEYYVLYLTFETVIDKIILQSGEVVSMKKIIGLSFCTHDWLHNESDHALKAKSLESMIQTHQPVQQRIVSLSK